LRIRDTLPVLSTAATAPTLPRGMVGPEDEEQGGISVAQIVVMLWAYRKLSALIALSVLTIGLVVTKYLPKTFAATATVMVNNDIKDPLAGKDLSTGLTGSGYIATEIQLMESPDVMLRVIDKLDLTAVSEYRTGYRDNGASLREWVKDRLLKDIEVSQGSQNSLLINVTASAHDPFRAAAIANAVADVYIDQQKQRLEKPATERAKRYAEQLAELKAKVSGAQDQVAAFRQGTGLVDLTQQKSVESEVLLGMQHRLDEAQSARRAAEVRAMAGQTTGNSATTASPVQNLRSQLTTQETQLAQLTSTLGPAHPKVIELKAQMEAIRRAIAAEAHTVASDASVEITSARQLEQKLQAAITEQSAKVLTVRKLQDEGNKLMVELESAQSVYKHALDGYDQIMFESAGNYNYVNIVSRAEPPQKSSKPNKPKLAILVAMMAAFFGLAGPLCYELFIDRRIRCVDDLERSFGVPVLVEFDAILTSASSA
jgi:succinoglycan biosynthesis transport protein ExoP